MNVTPEMKEKIESLINSSKVFLFMKGEPDFPQCGFSMQAVGALKEQGIEFKSYNILEDEELRQQLKVYANWPTYPQLYIDGKLVGGCDIVLQLASSGELKKLTE